MSGWNVRITHSTKLILFHHHLVLEPDCLNDEKEECLSSA